MFRNLMWLVLVVFWVPSPVSAQEVPSSVVDEARVAFTEGAGAFRESRWLDCAQSFERSFSLLFAPELLYNIGLCYQRAAAALPDVEATPLLERAVAAYRRYLRELPDAEDAPRVRSELSDLTSRMTRASPPREVVTPEPVPEVVPQEMPPTEVPVMGVPVSPPVEVRPRGEFPFTIVTGALTLVSTAIAVGLGLHAQSLYSGLASTCGQTPEGCADARISEVGSFALGANIMWAVSGLALIGTSVSFVVEFTATDTRPSLVALTVGRSF